MFEGGLKSNLLRWSGVVAGYAVLWGLVEAVGRYVVPSLQGLDQTISDVMNPDQYLFLVDEFFRALTDHTTFLISVPMVSLALAVAVYQMRSQQSVGAAWRIYGQWTMVWWVLVGVISYLEHPKLMISIALALAIPLLLGLIAGLHVLIPLLYGVVVRRYVGALLCIELVILLALSEQGMLPLAQNYGFATLLLILGNPALTISATLVLAASLIIGIIVGLHVLIPTLRSVTPRKYVTTVLWIETAVFLVLWAWGKLFWNEGLPGANYVLLPALILCFGGATVAFARMGDDAMRRYTGIFVIVMLSSISCGAIATSAIKDSIARPRPLAEANQPWNAVMRAIPEETLRGASSYPSGHVSGTVSMLTPLFWWVRSRRAKVGLATWGALQGVSRIYTAAHFFSDCVMGAFFGFGVGTLLFFLLGGPALRKPVEAN